MTYELCLEYGTYPLTVTDAQLGEDKQIPEFIKEDQELLDKLDKLNTLFHDLFLTIESQFHYVGHNFPEKRQEIEQVYSQVVKDLKAKYPDQDIIITKLLIS
ncbi:hypothetical protein [Streptococcus catagoni]|uniref:hypothetical protein n=1 Tax=Streptococcus catagoni TaxID=2654874 RepID=UPI0014086BD2|nr:hypothetical protein [Streptococcus catagoni]